MGASTKRPVLTVIGTRPEAIKLCPVVLELRNRGIASAVCATGQHGRLADEVFDIFGVVPEHRLKVMHPGQSLAALSGKLLDGLGTLAEEIRPSMVVVQGDTTTTLCASLVSFYNRIPVAHVEAGMRSFDMLAPFPEEMNRVLTSNIAELHFAATTWSGRNLRKEGVPAESIMVTGNTGVDSLLMVAAALERGAIRGTHLPLAQGKRLIVVTAHRRESLGECLQKICKAVETIGKRSDVQLVWPVHPNPSVRKAIRNLSCCENVHLVDPVDYVTFVNLIQQAYLLLTDSGGIQEEGSALGKPVLVLRDKTERPEGLSAGTSQLVGTDVAVIVEKVERLLDDPAEYQRMAKVSRLYGDGRASARIVERIAMALSGGAEQHLTEVRASLV
jgi:UDP-N-acetylglucosamine 2-epimerase